MDKEFPTYERFNRKINESRSSDKLKTAGVKIQAVFSRLGELIEELEQNNNVNFTVEWDEDDGDILIELDDSVDQEKELMEKLIETSKRKNIPLTQISEKTATLSLKNLIVLK